MIPEQYTDNVDNNNNEKDTSFLLEQVIIPEYQDHDMKLDKRKIGKKETSHNEKVYHTW